MIKNVFVNNNEINFTGKGKLATLNNLNELLCLGHTPVENILQIQEGIYRYLSEEEQQEIIKKDEDIEQWELDKCCGEYIQVLNRKPILYFEFLNDLDEGVEQIESCSFDEEDLFLRAVTKCRFNNTIYVYNYWKENNEIESIKVIAHKNMFQSLFETRLYALQ